VEKKIEEVQVFRVYLSKEEESIYSKSSNNEQIWRIGKRRFGRN